MKKFYQYFISGIVLLFIGIACTKEITDDLVVFFKVEFSETTLDAFVNTREESQFTIISGTDVNAGDYQIKYNVTEGAGTYAVNNVAIIENEFVDLPEGPQYTIEYLGTTIGTNRVTITLKDRANREEDFVIVYNVRDTDFTFDAIALPENTYVDGALDLNLNITEISTATYNVQYEFGTPDADMLGTGTIAVDGVQVDPLTDIEVPVGDTTWTFEGATVGTVELILTATSSLGISKTETILIEVTETPDFTFSVFAPPVDPQFTNTPIEFSFVIEETVGNSNYTMLFLANKPGTIEYNGVAYTEDSEIPIAVGVTTGLYSGSVSGTNELRFEVTNANTTPITKSSNITLELIDPDLEAPVINLNGPETITITVFDTYIETATASDNVDGDLNDQIVFGGNFVDTNTLGSYTRTYNVTDSSNNSAEQVTRTIIVVDDVAPVIDLNSSNNITIGIGATYTETATATDNFDGTITDQIVFGGNFVNTNTIGTFTRTYNVTDSSGNPATEIIKTINVVDDIKPVIVLNGPSSITLSVNDTYTETATASDNVDGNLTSEIVFGGTFVNTSTAGTYTRTYNVRDAANNAADQVIRTINVVDPVSFNRATGRLTAPAGSSVVVTMNSGGSGSGNANIQVRDSNSTRLGIGITCWGLAPGEDCLISADDTNPMVSEASFQFTMPLDEIAIFTGSHNPSLGDSGNGTSFTISVAGESFNGDMNVSNPIPQ
ncbi:immunoglobulin-like domain-containing protein [Aquimarina sp. SS2-1]|uniref:immunoglobulin-like domain-containing protein n=1 Tax=Aquimarina besae TaxID=3342247 RepID=UPI00366BAA99